MKKFIFLLLMMPVFLQAQQTYFDEGATVDGVTYKEPIEINTSEKVTFINCNFNTIERAILGVGDGVNIEIRNCTFKGEYWNNQDQNKAVQIYTPNSKSRFIFENNTGVGYRGVWLQKFGPGSEIKVRYNKWENIEGRPGGRAEPDPNGENSQFLMISSATDTDIDVSYNWIYQAPEEGKVEDVINFGEVKSTADNPALLHHNLILGAFH